jgi:hypothetical protein
MGGFPDLKQLPFPGGVLGEYLKGQLFVVTADPYGFASSLRRETRLQDWTHH